MSDIRDIVLHHHPIKNPIKPDTTYYIAKQINNKCGNNEHKAKLKAEFDLSHLNYIQGETFLLTCKKSWDK
jgi:hypothetical protein